MGLTPSYGNCPMRRIVDSTGALAVGWQDNRVAALGRAAPRPMSASEPGVRTVHRAPPEGLRADAYSEMEEGAICDDRLVRPLKEG